MKSRLKFIAKLIIALVFIIPVLAFSAWVFVSILVFVLLLAIFVKLTGGKVNFTVNNSVNK